MAVHSGGGSAGPCQTPHRTTTRTLQGTQCDQQSTSRACTLRSQSHTSEVVSAHNYSFKPGSLVLFAFSPTFVFYSTDHVLTHE